MHGGEIFVPKIPSMQITDLAEAMAPGLPHQGRRHPARREAARDDVPDRRLAPDAASSTTISSSGRPSSSSARMSTIMTNQLGENGAPVADGFEYNSGRNDALPRRRRDQGIQPDRESNDPLRPPGHLSRGYRRSRRGSALGLADAGAGGPRVRARDGRPIAARKTRSRSPTRPRRCTSPASRSISAPATRCGRHRIPSWHRPIARAIAAPRSISSISIREPTT